MSEPADLIHAHIDLGGIHGRVVREVRRTVHMTAVALSATPLASQPSLLPTDFRYEFNPPLADENLAVLGNEYPAWVLLTGFRELAEQISSILEECFVVRCYWRIVELQGASSKFSNEVLQGEVTIPTQRFHRLSLTDKIAMLTSDYDVALDPDIAAMMLSINAGRNCLVHRQGVVGDRDLDETGHLHLRWLRVSLQVRRPDGSRQEITLPYTVQEGDEMVVVREPASRVFERGSRIDVNAQTFADIGWTVTVFAQSLAKALESCGHRLGIAFGESAQAPASEPSAG